MEEFKSLAEKFLRAFPAGEYGFSPEQNLAMNEMLDFLNYGESQRKEASEKEGMSNQTDQNQTDAGDPSSLQDLIFKMKEICLSQKLSFFPTHTGFKCVKLCPDNSGKDRCFSAVMTHTPKTQWAVVVWKSEASGKKVKFLMEDHSSFGFLEAVQAGLKTLENLKD